MERWTYCDCSFYSDTWMVLVYHSSLKWGLSWLPVKECVVVFATCITSHSDMNFRSFCSLLQIVTVSFGWHSAVYTSYLETKVVWMSISSPSHNFFFIFSIKKCGVDLQTTGKKSLLESGKFFLNKVFPHSKYMIWKGLSTFSAFTMEKLGNFECAGKMYSCIIGICNFVLM